MSKRGDHKNKGRAKNIKPTNALNNNNNGDEKGNPTSPLVSAPITPQTSASPNESQTGKAGDVPHEGLLEQYTKSLRDWTGGLVFVGLITVAVLSLQWWTFEKTDETNRAGLRPYISGVGLSADIDRFPGYWALKATLENSGGTPPTQLRYVIRSSADFSLDPEEIFQRPSETDAFFEPTIAPKGQIHVEAGMPTVAFFDSKKQWYVSGAIHYRDQFSGSAEHISKFCFAIVKTNVTRPGYDPCPYWNCVDEKACTNDRARYDKAVRDGEIRPTKKSADAPDIPVGTAIPSAIGMVIKALP
ncbi:hypothetical protein [Bradyrhizobium sp. LTSPM299]|uniref:hypothetical protein n=1 Tax=Bradyrhizobium sp. LTSPM299 TaxID=1619233 RepID=UPI000AE79963|nr:hypothetical protein [Bradyrhizobium sp. LTSPM299]